MFNNCSSVERHCCKTTVRHILYGTIFKTLVVRSTATRWHGSQILNVVEKPGNTVVSAQAGLMDLSLVGLDTIHEFIQ